MHQAERLTGYVMQAWDTQLSQGVPLDHSDMEFYDILVKLANLHLRLVEFKTDPRKNFDRTSRRA